MALDVKPTRSELIKLKKRIKLAQSGYGLLKKKRDGLILEFFKILKEAKRLRSQVAGHYREALEKIETARLIESDVTLESLSLAIRERPQVQLGQANIMGVVVPRVSSTAVQKGMLQRGYSIASSSAVIDEAAEAFEKVVLDIVRQAETETAMKKILAEIDKTKRRVNALEFEVIPRMKRAKDFITLRLEEMERENVFRLKRIKKK
ncbi:MAG TPA: V-type ATP synthase subunit D [Candidatus Nanoarchaeia archaeon]|nr:V-type ATP synthase subunit D [Candidatus Nanoarchaeia archaeon]